MRLAKFKGNQEATGTYFNLVPAPILLIMTSSKLIFLRDIAKTCALIYAVVPSVLQCSLLKPYLPLIFQIKMRKPLLRTQPAFCTLALPPFSRVGRAAKVCAFLFEILRVCSVLSMQIAGFYKQLSFSHQCGLLDYQFKQWCEKFVLIWYFIALKFGKMK